MLLRVDGTQFLIDTAHEYNGKRWAMVWAMGNKESLASFSTVDAAVEYLEQKMGVE